MLIELRDKAYRALRSRWGDALWPVRWTKDLILFVNEMAGKPLASAEEIDARRERERIRRERLATIRAERARTASAAGGPAREVAPVVVYVDERSGRDVGRIKGVLDGRNIPFRELDLEHDEASRSWVLTRAKGRALPIVFIAGEPVGGYDELVQLDVSGELERRVFVTRS